MKSTSRNFTVTNRQFSRSVLIIGFVALLGLIAFVVSPNQIITAQTGGLDCSQVVPQAAKSLAASCNGLDRDQACYGNSLVNVTYMDAATPQPFAKVGDIVPLSGLKTITTAPLDTDKGQWGLAALKVQSNLPGGTAGQAVSFVLYGDSAINGLASALTGSPTATAAVCSAPTTRSVTLYAQPNFSAAKIGTLKSQTALTVIARLADNSWVQVDNQGTRGWLNPANLKLGCTLDSIPAIDPTSPATLNGSGAFYFTTGIASQSACQNVPGGGLLIRSPAGQKVAFRANGAEITIGSTVLFNARPNQAMTVSVLSGQASVLSYGQKQTAITGQTISIPLGDPPLGGRNDGLEVVGPPSIPGDISGDKSPYDTACALAKALGGTEPCGTTKPTPTSTLRFVTRTPIPPTLTSTPVPVVPNTSCTLSGFSASPNPVTLPAGGGTACTTVSWDVDGVNTVFLNGVGVVGHGSQQFCIAKATTYTLTLNCAGGNKSSAITVKTK